MCIVSSNIDEYNTLEHINNIMLDKLTEEPSETVENKINQLIDNMSDNTVVDEKTKENILIEAAYPYFVYFNNKFIDPFIEHFTEHFTEQNINEYFEKTIQNYITEDYMMNDASIIINKLKSKKIKSKNNSSYFLNTLYSLLINPQDYSNIITWKYNYNNKILIIIKNKKEVSKKLCPKAKNLDFTSCLRQFNNYSFNRIKNQQNINQYDIFIHQTLEDINNIINISRNNKKRKRCKKDNISKLEVAAISLCNFARQKL